MKMFFLASRLYTAQLLLVLRTRICKWIYLLSMGTETPLDCSGLHGHGVCSEWLTASSGLPSGSWESSCWTWCAASPHGAGCGRRVPGPGSVLCCVDAKPEVLGQLHQVDTRIAQTCFLLTGNCLKIFKSSEIFRSLKINLQVFHKRVFCHKLVNLNKKLSCVKFVLGRFCSTEQDYLTCFKQLSGWSLLLSQMCVFPAIILTQLFIISAVWSSFLLLLLKETNK